ncbi:hypothetical protein BU25DRAFT_180606 [Macroventuria anomochaeta]|uniref:Uncharacterized protein n=1 Tax=Macroventuria anomochaeta TaxID=301207 RepID=A0ACB6RPS3_9PLEO|nr:uncharacterized protein BU25DRAFT_180606 [Macroventuria anomochaeta]KAF2623262.1 hypothetical protein BU25DRAFT_180606 [Macroventuria anomochaeta]
MFSSAFSASLSQPWARHPLSNSGGHVLSVLHRDLSFLSMPKTGTPHPRRLLYPPAALLVLIILSTAANLETAQSFATGMSDLVLDPLGCRR